MSAGIINTRSIDSTPPLERDTRQVDADAGLTVSGRGICLSPSLQSEFCDCVTSDQIADNSLHASC